MTLNYADSGTASLPRLGTQEEFWNEWNQSWRFREPDAFMERQREMALSVAQDLRLTAGLRILDVGCGTGWFGFALRSFGEVWATDLSESAIVEGQRRHPGVQFVCGDFLTVELPGPFDLVLSNDSLINMYDQPKCVERIASLMQPGAALLLLTPNREIWRHRTALKPLGRGQIQHWLLKAEYVRMLQPYFEIERVATIDPGGDRGLLWWVENRYMRKGMSLLIGQRRWRNLLERLRLGRELVLVARRT